MKPLYHQLLRLYPAAFRRELGEEMEAFFEERLAAAGLRGALALSGVSLKAFADRGNLRVIAREPRHR